jgi:DNA-binding transcriptional regulator YiaG
MDLGLTQRELARKLAADPWTVLNWEKDRTSPAVRYVPAVIEFLGFNPFPIGDTFPDRLRAARQALGLSQESFARRLGVNPSTVQHWEQGRHTPPARYWPRILEVTGPEELPADTAMADRIRAYRRAHGFTQAQLGRLLGVPQRTVSEWELGLRCPDEQTCERFGLARNPAFSPMTARASRRRS